LPYKVGGGVPGEGQSAVCCIVDSKKRTCDKHTISLLLMLESVERLIDVVDTNSQVKISTCVKYVTADLVLSTMCKMSQI